MANRHLSRSVVLQSLFEWDFDNSDKKEIDRILKRNISEFAPGLDNISFAEELILGVLEKLPKIDKIIEKAAPEWPISQISIVDRNIIRLGLYELLFEERGEVPPKVAINEAIELAKAFGTESSSRFVNGVLGTVYKELGEPGKNDSSDKKKIDIKKLPVEKLGGAIVYEKNAGKINLAFVHDVFGYWTLSKGRLKEGEDSVKGTKREIKEEMGIDIDIEDELGSNEYIASDPTKGKIRKQVSYFLAKAKTKKLILGTSGGLNNVKWFPATEVAELRMYDDIRPLIIKAIKILKKKD